jgi:hypothetical protein
MTLLRACSGLLKIRVVLLAVGACDRAEQRSLDYGLPSWSAAEDFRIGSLDDPTQALAPIPTRGIAVGPRGHVYVGQRFDQEIRIYDEVARLVRVIGGKGGGPGEFTALEYLGILGDTLYAINLFPPRLTLFSLSGDHLSTNPIALAAVSDDYVAAPPYLLFPDGTGLASPGFEAERVLANERIRRIYLRVDREGNVIDTVFSHPAARSTIVLALRGGRALATSQPFQDWPLVAFTSDGRRMAVVDRDASQNRQDGASFRVTVMTTAGGVLYAREYGYEPVHLPAQVVDSAVAVRVRFVAHEFSTALDAEKAVREAMYIPAYYPPVTDLDYANNGNLWIKREHLGERLQRWEVHDPNGRRCATIELPSTLDIKLIQGDAIWAVELDQYDVPYVVRYRITGSTGCSKLN